MKSPNLSSSTKSNTVIYHAVLPNIHIRKWHFKELFLVFLKCYTSYFRALQRKLTNAKYKVFSTNVLVKLRDHPHKTYLLDLIYITKICTFVHCTVTFKEIKFSENCTDLPESEYYNNITKKCYHMLLSYNWFEPTNPSHMH